MENQQRAERGQDPLPEEDITTIFKKPYEPSRLDSLLTHKQLAQYCDQITDYAGTNFTKLFYANELQKL